MKKTLLFILGALLTVSAFSQGKVFLAWSDTAQAEQSGFEAQMIAAIEALPQVEYIEYINSSADWVLLQGDAANFDLYDGVIICESGGSNNSLGYGSINYPKPTILLEPFVLHKTGWEWYASSMFVNMSPFNSEDRFVEVIENADHPIFTGLGFNNGDEVKFAEGPVEASAGSYGIPVDQSTIAAIADNATPLAKNKLAVSTSQAAVNNMWAIEANDVTPRIFLWGYHAADLATQHEELAKLMANAALWVLGEEITAGVENESVPEVSAIPVGDELVVKGAEVAEVSVYSISGALALSSKGSSTVNISGLANGVYMAVVSDVNGVITTTKFVK